MVATVAVTGATGFIGQAFVEHLCRHGWRVRALYRDAAKIRSQDGSGIQWLRGDLADSASLRELLRGADALIYCAGTVRGATNASFQEANVAGVERAASAAANMRPAPRILGMSSVAARAPELSDYAASKRAGEKALATAAKNAPWTLFRPPAVYGPGERELLVLFKLMRYGFVPLMADDTARFSLLYIDDLVRAGERWLLSGIDTRKIYELHDGCSGGYRWHDLVAAAERMFGRRMHRLPIPPGMLKLLAGANRALAQRMGYAPMLTPGKVRELRHPDWVCDNGAISDALAWHPEVRLEEGLRHTLQC